MLQRSDITGAAEKFSTACSRRRRRSSSPPFSIAAGAGMAAVSFAVYVYLCRQACARARQRRQLAGGGFPFGIQFRQAFLHMHHFAVHLRGAARLFVSRGIFQLGGKFGELRFELLNFLFHLMNQLLLRFALAGTGLALPGFETFLILTVQRSLRAFGGRSSTTA